MKKFIAVLMSVLMLCTVIPFAAVSAYEVPTIVATPSKTEVEAGDVIKVEVSLMGNPGVIGAMVDVLYDQDVFELIPYEEYDEEEDETYVYNVERATGWSASKVFFGPDGSCSMGFANGTASKNVTKVLYFTATFKVKADAPAGPTTLEVDHDNGNFVNVDGEQVDFAAEDTVITVKGNEPTCEHQYSGDCDADCNLCGAIREAAAHTYFDGCSPICDVCGYEREVSHNVIAVAAKAPTCTEIGNIEYWYCDVCGAAWLDAECTMNTNQMAVKLGATCSTNAVYTAANAATCYEPGNVENWYCANCDVYYLDAACTIITNRQSTIIPVSHNVIAVEAKAATCYENGNIAYWYCADCGQAWLDELCHLNTNLKAVILPMAHAEATHVDAVAPTCTENGNIEYWYCADCGQAWLDAECMLNTNLLAVILPSLGGHTYDGIDDASCNVCGEINDAVEYKIVTYSGSSVAEDKNGVSGLAFLFNVNVADIAIKEDTIKEAAYEGSSVIIDGVKYDVKGMGAMVSNNDQIATSLEENANLINIPAKWLYNLEAFSASFAVRVIGIPEIGYGVDVTAVPYVVYEVDGVEYIHFGVAQVNSVNNALN